MTLKIAAKIAALGLAAAPALFAMPAAAANPVARYNCDDGTQVIATFRNAPSGPGSVVLAFPRTGMKLILPQALSADGGRYAAGRTEFWIKGQQARFTRGASVATCSTR